ncbi:MAG: hypothetical protein NTX50_12680, partial [Candidatus Sumerlaeota bacterium]|nr:hypothetical protein [Candidatus Sumerlaeota bacterium]
RCGRPTERDGLPCGGFSLWSKKRLPSASDQRYIVIITRALLCSEIREAPIMIAVLPHPR